MTAKEYLNSIRKYKRITDSFASQIEDIRNEIGGLRAIRYDTDKVQTSPSNRMEELIPKLIKLEESYTSALVHYRTEMLKRISLIATLPNQLHVTVLTLRYVEGKRWEEIALETDYSFRHITRIHGDALQSFTALHKDVLECP